MNNIRTGRECLASLLLMARHESLSNCDGLWSVGLGSCPLPLTRDFKRIRLGRQIHLKGLPDEGEHSVSIEVGCHIVDTVGVCVGPPGKVDVRVLLGQD